MGRQANRSCQHLMGATGASRNSLRKLRPKTSEGVLLDLISDIPASVEKASDASSPSGSTKERMASRGTGKDGPTKGGSMFRIESDETFY